jgi:hypothetical protein
MHSAIMATEHLIPEDLRDLYQVKEWRNATGILQTACPSEWTDIVEVLRNFRLLKSEVLTAGEGLSPISKGINAAFDSRGWEEKGFQTTISIKEGSERKKKTAFTDKYKYNSPTHLVDCFKGRVALELEWNNKDPFFDRDLNNFRLLFELRTIDVGVIITRSWDLQGIFNSLGKGKSYGATTTHHNRLWPRLEGGGGGGCPVLTFAISPKLYVDDGPDALAAAFAAKAERDAKRKAKGKKTAGAVPLDAGSDDEGDDESEE